MTEILSTYHGKVRDVHRLPNNKVALVATDRISAFDVILPQPIPGKGQVLNQIAAYFLRKTAHIVPNWLEDVIHPQVSVGKYATPFKVEMVVRGCLTGHAWRTYRDGKRTLCGVPLPDGMLQNQPFEKPIITPTTKAEQGEHDEDISHDDIIKHHIVDEQDYSQLEAYSIALFEYGQKMARERGLILVDTKYEFGKTEDGTIVIIDEIHTPDSSRYFIADGFENSWKNNLSVRQLSKEFVREWLLENGFSGQENQNIPEMTNDVVTSIQNRYIELYEMIVGTPFAFNSEEETPSIKESLSLYLQSLRNSS